MPLTLAITCLLASTCWTLPIGISSKVLGEIALHSIFLGGWLHTADVVKDLYLGGHGHGHGHAVGPVAIGHGHGHGLGHGALVHAPIAVGHGHGLGHASLGHGHVDQHLVLDAHHGGGHGLDAGHGLLGAHADTDLW